MKTKTRFKPFTVTFLDPKGQVHQWCHYAPNEDVARENTYECIPASSLSSILKIEEESEDFDW